MGFMQNSPNANCLKAVLLFGVIEWKVGIYSTSEKLDAIIQVQAPKNIQELWSLLGLINYYGKFVRNVATMLNFLNCLLHKDVP